MTRKTRRLVAVSIVAASALGDRAARADPSGTDAVRREGEAQALFDEAKGLLAAGQIADACRKFKASQEIDPGAGTELNLADCYERAGRLATAWATFKAAGADARRSGRAQWGVIADTRAENLEPRVPKVIVRLASQAPGTVVEVLLDGDAIASGALGSRVPVDPGDHTIVARSPGRAPFSRTVTVTARTLDTVDVPALAALPLPVASDPPRAPPPAGARWTRVASLSAAGGAVVAIGVGAYFGLDVLSKNSTAATECPKSQCPTSALVDLQSEAQSSRTSAIVAFSAGGALSVAAVVLLVISVQHPVAVTPTATVGEEGFSVGLRGAF